MDPRHARYPFFAAARRAVEAADIALPSLVAADAPAVERGLERVRRAIMEGTVVAEESDRWEPRDELLSYPIARILVSLVCDDRGAGPRAPAVVDKYAAAEAATAAERFLTDFADADDGLRSTAGTERVTFESVLREFDLDDEVTPVAISDANGASGRTRTEVARDPQRFQVALGAYLTLSDSDWGDRWRLVNRELADGTVVVGRDELHRLLREAVRRRVAEGLPFAVRGSTGGDRLADALDAEVAELRDLLADRAPVHGDEITAVAPGLFPPCVRNLLDRARAGEDMAVHSRFALVAFLVGLGMTAAEVRELLGGDKSFDAQVTYLRSDGDGGTQYAPPSCATLQAYGDCVDMDDRCETIDHPTKYYVSALDDADADEVTDWRSLDRTADGDDVQTDVSDATNPDGGTDDPSGDGAEDTVGSTRN